MADHETASSSNDLLAVPLESLIGDAPLPTTAELIEDELKGHHRHAPAVPLLHGVSRAERLCHVVEEFTLDHPSEYVLEQIQEESKSTPVSAALQAPTDVVCTHLPFNNFLKGVKWSPDGLCLLANSEDNVLRLFEMPDPPSSEIIWADSTLVAMEELANAPVELPVHPSSLTSSPSPSSDPSQSQSSAASYPLKCVLRTRPGETIYDFAWYPLMHSAQPETCCYLTTARDKPIQLWDAFTGAMRGSYRAYDQADELTSAISLAFSPDGNKIYSGFNRTVRIFDLARPGKFCEKRDTLSTHRINKRRIRQGQPGIISCIQVAPDSSGTYAAGSYAGVTCIYACDNGELIASLEGHQNGVTHLCYSPDGRLLFTGGRKDNEILCWDVRNTNSVLARFSRVCSSNQRIYFDVDPLGGRFLITGSEDKRVICYDLTAPPDPDTLFVPPHRILEVAHDDSVHGVAFHPHFSSLFPLMASCSGQRKFNLPRIHLHGRRSQEAESSHDQQQPVDMEQSEDEKENEEEEDSIDNSLTIWRLHGPVEVAVTHSIIDESQPGAAVELQPETIVESAAESSHHLHISATVVDTITVEATGTTEAVTVTHAEETVVGSSQAALEMAQTALLAVSTSSPSIQTPPASVSDHPG